MPRVRISPGRARRQSRGGALGRALTASGEPPLLLTYEGTQSGACERFFFFQAVESGYREMGYSEWPTEETSLAAVPLAPLFRDGGEAVYRLEDGSLAFVMLRFGFARCRIAAPSVAALEHSVASFQAVFPATFLALGDFDRIPITFWMMSSYGPTQRLRMIDTASWSAIEQNYPADVRAALAPLMDGTFEPGKSGQLLLWQGPPGTGKTWALRALASEWRSWAEFSYITDPDAFFVEQASYMVDVLLADSYSAIEETSGDIYSEAGPEGKWRVLILEDTGELLSATAKEKYGQGLSRLLNVVDGMIGQGLRVLCLVTTNDELGELNEAVRRPGRCASQIVFPSFPADEARAWLASRVVSGNDSFDDVTEPMSLAEMYAKAGEGQDDPIPPRPEEFEPEPEDARDLMASAAADVAAQIAAVAEAHQDETVGYGETAFDPETGIVFWVHGDWTDHDPARTDFLAIDGVNAVECEAEALPDGWPFEAVVYPENPPKWVTVPPEKAQAALDEVVALASEPLV